MTDAPDTAEARRRYAQLAASYGRRGRWIERRRIDAVRQLALRPGDHVLDVGCGTGESLAPLVAAVGPTGRVTGVDLSDEMAAVARDRIAGEGWDNVDVVVGEASVAPLPGPVDGALFFLTHDLVRTPAVVDNVLGACRPGASIVAFGGKAPPRWNWPLHTWVHRTARHYITTFDGFDQPWSHFGPRLDDLVARDLALGAFYMSCGRVPGPAG
jgi:demethylmenaquinone methyltransferase/2-methoxy-6-polyprenyl-1,4-benzoquinol methylase